MIRGSLIMVCTFENNYFLVHAKLGYLWYLYSHRKIKLNCVKTFKNETKLN